MLVWNIPNFVNKGRQVVSIGWVKKQSTYLRCLWLQLVSLYNFSVSFKQSVIGRHRYAEIKISFVSFSAIAYRLLYLYLFYFILFLLRSPLLSMTRLLDYLFTLWPFTTFKMCPKLHWICQREPKSMPIIWWTLSKWTQFFTIVPFWRNFAKSGHTPSARPQTRKLQKKKRKRNLLKMCFGKTFKNIVFLSLFVARKWK